MVYLGYGTILPQGKTDLEFIGKYDQKYAGLRFVVEFKYISNAKFKKMKTPVKNFKLKKKDADQLKNYVDSLKKSYPTATIKEYLIYCFGNKGFRVFDI